MRAIRPCLSLLSALLIVLGAGCSGPRPGGAAAGIRVALQRQGLHRLEGAGRRQRPLEDGERRHRLRRAGEAPGDKNLWSAAEYGDFVLRFEWRIKDTPYVNPSVPIIRVDGTHKKGADGKEIRLAVPDSDSGVYVRGSSKAQINIWAWPIGSGEVYGYRMDPKMPPEVRAGVTPKANADRDIGQWNEFEITMKGDRLTVVLNGITVLDNAQLPDVPARGPLALQHHGQKKDGVWTGPPSLVQFRNISIKALN